MRIRNIVSIFVCGLCIGWLVGLSISPVLHFVITAVMGTIGAVVAAAFGLTQAAKVTEKSVAVSPLPLAFLLVGILVGSGFGLRARVNDWFAPEPTQFANNWKSTNLPPQQLTRFLFAELHPATEKAGLVGGVNAHSPVLFAAVGVNDCDSMKLEREGELKAHLKILVTDDLIKQKIDRCDQQSLETIRDIVCAEQAKH